MARDKSWYFKQNPLTADLSLQERERLEGLAEIHDLRKKQALWLPGEPANRVHFIRSGLVKVSRVSEDGRELTLHLIQRNDLLGEFSLVTNGSPRQPYETVAETLDESVIYSVSADEFLRLMKENMNLAMRVTQLIADRRRSLEQRIDSLLFKTAHARLASLFLNLADRFGVRDSRGLILNLKLTHRDMASLIGASRETVSFAILDLRKDGLILTEDKRVVLLDETRLTDLARS